MNKNKMIKVISCAMLLVAGGFAVSNITGCTRNDGEITVKDPKVRTFYDSLKTIANSEYKRIKGLNDNTDYIKGISSALCEYYQEPDITFAYTMYTDTDAVNIEIVVSASNEKECVNKINENANNVSALSLKSEVGELYSDETFKNYILDYYTDRTPKDKSSERYYYDSTKPLKYVAYKLENERVSLSMTGTSGAGIVLSIQNWEYSTEPSISTSRTGNSQEIKEDKIPITYSLLKDYINF